MSVFAFGGRAVSFGVGAWVAFGVAAVAPASVPTYVNVGSFGLPTGSSVFDVQADGRLITVDENGAVSRQNALNGSSYAPAGSLPAGAVPSFGAGFVRISPDGSKLAVSDNGVANHMYVVQTAALSTSGPTPVQTINVPSFDGVWTGPNTMYIAGMLPSATDGSLTRIDVTSGTGMTVAFAVGGASGGVAARAGRLYAGAGLAGLGAQAGDVRSFDLATLDTTPFPLLFGNGTLEAGANTASSLAFDALGDLIIAGFGGVSVFDPARAQRYDLPGLSATGFYSATFDGATGEILVRDYGATTVVRYGVPAPGCLGLVAGIGCMLKRRRSA